MALAGGPCKGKRRTEKTETASQCSYVDIALCSVMRDCALRREEAVRIVIGKDRITPDQKHYA